MKGFIASLKVAIFLSYASVSRANLGVVVFTVLILALVGLNLLFVPGLLDGLVAGADSKVKDTFAGDIVVESASDSPFIYDSAGLSRSIGNIAGVVATAERSTVSADLVFGNERTSCTISGVHPAQERSVFTIDKYLIEGSFLSDNDSGILLGVQLAGAGRSEIELYSRSLKKVHAGDSVSVNYANGTRKTYDVRGIFKTDFIQTDLQAFVTSDELASVLPVSQRTAQSIRVKTIDEGSVVSVSSAISRTVQT